MSNYLVIINVPVAVVVDDESPMLAINQARTRIYQPDIIGDNGVYPRMVLEVRKLDEQIKDVQIPTR